MRIGALKYLAVLPKIVRYDVLHPQKAMVLRELAKALDDPKRAVRKEAVDARFVQSIPAYVPLLISHPRSSQDKLGYVFWLDVVMTRNHEDQVLACTLLLYSTAGSCDPWLTVSLPGCSQLEYM